MGPAHSVVPDPVKVNQILGYVTLLQKIPTAEHIVENETNADDLLSNFRKFLHSVRHTVALECEESFDRGPFNDVFGESSMLKHLKYVFFCGIKNELPIGHMKILCTQRPQLEILGFCECKLTSEHVAPFENNTTLMELYLSQTGIDDEGIGSICKSMIESFSILQEKRVTSDGLMYY